MEVKRMILRKGQMARSVNLHRRAKKVKFRKVESCW